MKNLSASAKDDRPYTLRDVSLRLNMTGLGINSFIIYVILNVVKNLSASAKDDRPYTLRDVSLRLNMTGLGMTG